MKVYVVVDNDGNVLEDGFTDIDEAIARKRKAEKDIKGGFGFNDIWYSVKKVNIKIKGDMLNKVINVIEKFNNTSHEVDEYHVFMEMLAIKDELKELLK